MSSFPRSRRTLRGLGDDASILAQVFQGQSGKPAADNVRQVVQQAMSQGSLYTTENCSGIPRGGNTATLVTSALGGALVKFGVGAGPAAPILLIAGGVLQVFGAIFGHHAQKVKQEQQIICAVVQSINDSLSVIDQALQAGQVTPQQAAASLDQLYTDLQQSVQPILKQDSDHCNAACFILAEARGVIAKRKDAYLRIAPANAPQGSYLQTCRNIVVQGDILTAECEDTSGNWKATSLPTISACAGGQIANMNGQLRCCDPSTAVGSTDCKPYTPAVSAAGQPISTATGNVVQAVQQAASAAGLPAWALWGAGLLLAVKLFRG